MTSQVVEARARLQHLLSNTLMDTREDEDAVRVILAEIDRAEREHMAEADSLRDRTLQRTVEAQQLRAAVRALIKVWPSNWEDDEDPEQADAWRLAEAALGGRQGQAAGGHAWRHIATVADLVNNLLTLDQAMQAHGAIFVELDGRTRAKVRSLSLSREKVEGQWIERGSDGPWHLVIWSNADKRPETEGS